jgi:hypothetical protein
LDYAQNAINISDYIIVPESERSETFGSEVAISHDIFCGFVVLTAINFNDETTLAADKIANIAVDRLLSYKFVRIDLPVSNTIP